MPRFSVETEFDKINKTLAEAKSDCELLRSLGECHKDDCVNCRTNKLVNDLYNKCADIDKLAIDNMAARLYAIKYAMHKDRYKKYIGITAKTIKSLMLYGFILLIAFLAIWFMIWMNSYKMNMPRDYLIQPYIYNTNGLEDKRLLEILEPLYTKTHKYITDINHDLQVNCIDYSVIFKQFYDTDYYYKKDCCEIVHNVNDDFNHLFIRIRYDIFSNWEYIEPQNTYPCTMSVAWGDVYNPIFNIYGETNKWLKK